MTCLSSNHIFLHNGFRVGSAFGVHDTTQSAERWIRTDWMTEWGRTVVNGQNG